MPLFVVAGYKDGNGRLLEPERPCLRHGRRKASAAYYSEEICGFVVRAIYGTDYVCLRIVCRNNII
jgi:hypothetical protein